MFAESQTDERSCPRVLAMEQYGKNAAGCLLPIPLLFPLPGPLRDAPDDGL